MMARLVCRVGEARSNLYFYRVSSQKTSSTVTFLYPYRYGADTALVHKIFLGGSTLVTKQGSYDNSEFRNESNRERFGAILSDSAIIPHHGENAIASVSATESADSGCFLNLLFLII